MKKTRISRLLVLACALIMVVGSFAYFTDKAEGNAVGTAGTMNLVLVKDNWDAFNNKTMIPGDPAYDLGYTIKNTGNIQMDVRQSLTFTFTQPMTDTSAPEFALALNGAGNPTGAWNGEKTVYTVTFEDITLDGADQEDYTATLTFAKAAKNAFMGKTATLQYNAYAKQHANTEEADFAQFASYEIVADS